MGIKRYKALMRNYKHAIGQGVKYPRNTARWNYWNRRAQYWLSIINGDATQPRVTS